MALTVGASLCKNMAQWHEEVCCLYKSYEEGKMHQ